MEATRSNQNARAGRRYLRRFGLLLYLRPSRFSQLGKPSLRRRAHRSPTTNEFGLFPLGPHFLGRLGDTLAAGGTHTTTRTWRLRGRLDGCGCWPRSMLRGSATDCSVQCFKCGDSSVQAITFGSKVGKNAVCFHLLALHSLHVQLLVRG